MYPPCGNFFVDTVLSFATIWLSISQQKDLFNTKWEFKAEGGGPGKMCTGRTQPSLCHQAAAIINEYIRRSTQGAEKVDNDLCLPEGEII